MKDEQLTQVLDGVATVVNSGPQTGWIEGRVTGHQHPNNPNAHLWGDWADDTSSEWRFNNRKPQERKCAYGCTQFRAWTGPFAEDSVPHLRTALKHLRQALRIEKSDDQWGLALPIRKIRDDLEELIARIDNLEV